MGTPLQLFLFVFSSLYQISQYKKMKAAADKRKGSVFNIKNDSSSLSVLYGKNLVGGVQFDHQVRDNYTHVTQNADKEFVNALTTSKGGSKNEFLYAKQVFAVGEVSEVLHATVDGKPYNHRDYKSGVRINVHNTGGVADAMLTGQTSLNYPSTDKFNNLAYAALCFKLDRDKQNFGAAPDVQFFVKGSPVHSVVLSEGVYSLSATKAYSNNPALVLLDYLTNTLYGKGLPVSKLDLESFYHAAQICDLEVLSSVKLAGHINNMKPISEYPSFATFPDPDDWGYEDTILKDVAADKYYEWNKTGGTDDEPTGAWSEVTLPTAPSKLYECNLSLDTKNKLRDNIETILQTMGYPELIWNEKGQYKLMLEHPGDLSGVTLESLITQEFNEDNIIREKVDITFPSAADRFNQVTVNFQNESEDFKTDSVVWPEKSSSVYSVYLSEDNNQALESSMEGAGITTLHHAKAKAEQIVRASRSLYTIVFTANKDGLKTEVGDFIRVNLPLSNIDNQIFRVQKIKINESLNVEISAYLYDENVLAWNVEDDFAYKNKQDFDFIVPKVSNVVFTPEVSEFKTNVSGKLTWDLANLNSASYVIEVSGDSGVTWSVIGENKNNYFDVFGLKSGVYAFAVTTKTPFGYTSDRVTSDEITLQTSGANSIVVIYADDLSGTNATYTYSNQAFLAYYSYVDTLPELTPEFVATLSFLKFVGDDGADGLTGTSVLVVYAEDTVGTNQSLTADTREYVNYYEYTGEPPALPITGTFVKFVGTGQSIWPIYASDALGSDQSFSASGEAEITSSLLTLSGESPVWENHTIALSAYANRRVQVLFRYRNGNTANPAYLGDLQLDNITLNGTSYTFEGSESIFTRVGGLDGTIPSKDDASWEALAIGNVAGKFNRRTGTTPSSDTGGLTAQQGAYYAYAETSSPATYSTYFWLKTSEIILGETPEISFYVGRDGTNIGTLEVFLYAEGVEKPFVTFYEAQTQPTLPVSNQTFVRYEGLPGADGADGLPGADGADGADGERGAGWWRTVVTTTPATNPATLTQTQISALFSSAIGLTPSVGDRFIIADSTTTYDTAAYIFDGADWIGQAQFIDGNLLVNGTITGSKIAANSITSDLIEVENLAAVNANLGRVNISDSLRLNEAGASFIAGRESLSDYLTPGFFIGRSLGTEVSATELVRGLDYEILSVGTTDFVTLFGAEANEVGVTFKSTEFGDEFSGSGVCYLIESEVSFTSRGGDVLSGVISNSLDRLKIYNPIFVMGGSLSGENIDSQTKITTSQTSYSLGSGNRELFLSVLGGGGAGGYGTFNTTGSGSGTAGGTTTVTVKTAGGVQIATYSALGGAGGLNAVNTSGSQGESSDYGIGGLPGTSSSNTSGKPATGYGAGGGGGYGAYYQEYSNESGELSKDYGYYGQGGKAGSLVNIKVDLSSYEDQEILLDVTIGAGGPTNTPNYDGGAGASGLVAYSFPFSGLIEADKLLGVDQTWTNVTAIRNQSTYYQNTSGHPILVSIDSTSSSSFIVVSPDLVDFITISSAYYGCQFVVPNGYYYACNVPSNTGISQNWAELT